MTSFVPSEARILTSASFRRARLRAAQTSASVSAMRSLLDEVVHRKHPMPLLRSGSGRLHLDIICSVVEAHLESLEEADEAEEMREEVTSITGAARLRLAVAALHYLVDPDDVIPDSLPHGDVDDLIVLRWAARMTVGELPVQ